jgi:hydroxypyruvate isomerase
MRSPIGSWAVGNAPFEQAVGRVSCAGCTGLDLTAPAHLGQRAAPPGQGTQEDGRGEGLDLEIGLNRRDQHERIEKEIRAAIGHAQRLGIPNVICFSGYREGLDDATGLEVTAEGLRRVAPAAEEAGVSLVLELLNSKVDHPDYQADHTTWGVGVCQAVGSPRVKLLYDIYHMQVMEGDVIRTLRSAHPLIGLYHTAGNPGRSDLDDAQELNYPVILKAIKGTGYAGYLAHEFIPKGEPVAAAALRTVFQQCAPWLEGQRVTRAPATTRSTRAGQAATGGGSV